MSDSADRQHDRYTFDPDDYPEAKLPAAKAGDFVVSRGLLPQWRWTPCRFDGRPGVHPTWFRSLS